MQFTIDEINRQFKNQLNSIYSLNEIQQLLFMVYESVLNFTKIEVLTNTVQVIEEDKYNSIINIKERLISNEPIQYILGEADFFDLKFKVDSSVLIPRPETEEIVQWVIDSCDKKDAKILDMGTGSGCIAVSLAKNIIGSQVSAVDISKKALEIAQYNTHLNNTAVKFIHYDILKDNFDKLPQLVDVLISNPPYIKNSERTLMKHNVLDFEPNIALFVSDDDPLIFYREIAKLGRNILKLEGILFFEINESLGDEMVEMVKLLGYNKIELREDINGKKRMLRARV